MEKEDNQATASRKTSSSTRPLPEEQVIKCPRCDSPNTKFCYYNNYSLTQPRHFCKTCRRYWTKGGALRSVPIGGGCRKSKKVKSSSRLSSDSSELGGLKFFQGLAPAMDFQLGGLTLPNLSPPHPAGNYNQNLFGGGGDSGTSSDIPSGNSGNLLGFSYAGPMDLTSSIESLSSINQDLHWKLQQQRLAMIFGTGEDKQDGAVLEKQQPQPQPLPFLFDNLEGTKAEAGRNLRRGDDCETTATEWFFGNSFTGQVATTPTMSNWNIGIPGWSTDFHQYSSLP